jgi:hypothetical protein
MEKESKKQSMEKQPSQEPKDDGYIYGACGNRCTEYDYDILACDSCEDNPENQDFGEDDIDC